MDSVISWAILVSLSLYGLIKFLEKAIEEEEAKKRSDQWDWEQSMRRSGKWQ
jgi:hypothetical protein